MAAVNRQEIEYITFNFSTKTVKLEDGKCEEIHSALLHSSNTSNGVTPRKKEQVIKSHRFEYKNGQAKLIVRYKDGSVSTATWNEAR